MAAVSKKVLLLGGAGFIGYYITQELHKLGQQVIIYDSFINYLDHAKSNYRLYLHHRLKDLYTQAKIIKGDIRDTSKLTRVISQEKPDTIVLLSAIPLATVCNKFASEALDINHSGIASIVRAIGETGLAKKIVYTSSSFVYGDFQYTPCDEKHPTNVIDVYGGTKLAGENVIRGFAVRYGLDFIIIRPSAVYGPLDANLRVSQIFVENALRGQKLIVKDPDGQLDFSYVKDTAHGFVLAITTEKIKNEVFNITRGQGRSLREFVQILKTLVPNLEAEIGEEALDEKRPKRGSLDISKAKELLGYEPKYSLEEGLAEYVAFVKSILKI